jgi:hypothetical protein
MAQGFAKLVLKLAPSYKILIEDEEEYHIANGPKKGHGVYKNGVLQDEVTGYGVIRKMGTCLLYGKKTEEGRSVTYTL